MHIPQIGSRGWLAVGMLGLVLLVGCGPKTPAAAPAADQSESKGITADIPDSPDAKSFAKDLVDTTIVDFAIAEGLGGEVTYRELIFQGDGSWKASASFTADGEQFDCKESGKWSIEEASSSSTATMEWRVGNTTCPTREANSSVRVQVRLTKNGAEIAFR